MPPEGGLREVSKSKYAERESNKLVSTLLEGGSRFLPSIDCLKGKETLFVLSALHQDDRLAHSGCPAVPRHQHGGATTGMGTEIVADRRLVAGDGFDIGHGKILGSLAGQYRSAVDIFPDLEADSTRFSRGRIECVALPQRDPGSPFESLDARHKRPNA